MTIETMTKSVLKVPSCEIGKTKSSHMDFIMEFIGNFRRSTQNSLSLFGSGNLETHLKKIGDHEMGHYWAFSPRH